VKSDVGQKFLAQVCRSTPKCQIIMTIFDLDQFFGRVDVTPPIVLVKNLVLGGWWIPYSIRGMEFYIILILVRED